MNREKRERICLNCSQFLPSSMEEATELGICLADQDFEPYIDGLLDGSGYSFCHHLIDSKQFLAGREACKNFDEAEQIEIDDESYLGCELKRLAESNQLTHETFELAFLEERIRAIDWKNAPVAPYLRQLKNPDREIQQKGISGLSGLISHGNQEAFNVLFEYLKRLPPPKTIQEVHIKKDVLKQLTRNSTREQIAPYLINELYKTPSNNTTRQWLTDIFKFFEFCPIGVIKEPLEKMVRDKRFSYRLKRKMKDILKMENPKRPTNMTS